MYKTFDTNQFAIFSTRDKEKPLPTSNFILYKCKIIWHCNPLKKIWMHSTTQCVRGEISFKVITLRTFHSKDVRGNLGASVIIRKICLKTKTNLRHAPFVMYTHDEDAIFRYAKMRYNYYTLNLCCSTLVCYRDHQIILTLSVPDRVKNQCLNITRK